MDLLLRGADCLLPDGFAQADVHLSDGRIAALDPSATAGLRSLNLTDYWILPGVIDLHGDGFERHVAPRRGAINNLTAGLHQTEAELAANGITTAYLAQFYSWEGGMRGPDFARAICEALQGFAPIGTDMRLQLRFETHLLQDYDVIAGLVRDYAIDYMVMNDHLPHAALAAGKTPPRLTGQALKSGRSPDAHHALLRDLHANAPQVPQVVADLVARLAPLGLRFGSHDDSSADARAQAAAMGLTIAEFPENMDAAKAAQAQGAAVIMGAPNVLRGGSHKKNVSARDLIDAGVCDALASDYHYGAPVSAAQLLAPDLGWAQAWHLISAGPAAVMGWDDRGTIAPGARADLVIMPKGGGRIMATIAGGRFTHLTHPLASALLG